MSAWDWVHEFERRASEKCDGRRLWLAGLFDSAYGFRETNPDLALNLFAEGRRLAEELQEPWWALFYDRWRVHALLHFKRD
jgi:hypothetical protein